MMQPGRYTGTLVKGVVSKSKGGAPQAAVVFTITRAGVEGAWQPLEQTQERTVYLSMSGGAIEYTKKKLKSLGYQSIENVDDEPRIRFDAEASGGEIELNCEHSTYNGSTNERWDLANWGGSGPIAADDATAMEFAALMGE